MSLIEYVVRLHRSTRRGPPSFISVSDDSIVYLIMNSSPPGAAYMRQLIESALVQKMARRLFGVKPLSKPMPDYYQLDP